MTTTTPWDSSWTGYAAARDRFFAGLAAGDRTGAAPAADPTDSSAASRDEAAAAPPPPVRE